MVNQPKRDEHFALDADGRALPYGPAEVKAIVKKMIDEGEILAVGLSRQG